ncbi:ATP-dependent 6-phosphofructokinase [bacterium]|nr:ATP-dependent 6-phosphofructokinase [bacterium]
MAGKSRRKRIGILTGGGDCPGLNAVIRGVAKASMRKFDMDVIGFEDGFAGLVERKSVSLTWERVSGILTQGGTILGTTNRANPFNWPVDPENPEKNEDRSDRAVAYFHKLGLDTLVCIGGDGTQTIGHQLSQKGIHVVGVPKTIDNDIMGTDITFGFDSAVTTAAEAIDKIHSTAMSHHRVMVVEVMGRYAGWLALHAGIAGGGDVILIPEIPYEIDAICRLAVDRSKKGKRFSIIVVAEGAHPHGGERVVRRMVKGSPDPVRLGGIGQKVAHDIEEITGIETRVTVLGHLQRGGTPTPFDRVLATRFGVKAAELCYDGVSGVMVALRGTEIMGIPLAEVSGKNRLVAADHPLIETANGVGVCLGV